MAIKKVIVKAKGGCGEFDKGAFMDVPRHEFPDAIPMEIGTQLETHDEQLRPMHPSIVRVGDDTVKLDFNHPMAGKKLHFSGKITGLRAATNNWGALQNLVTLFQVNHGVHFRTDVNLRDRI